MNNLKKTFNELKMNKTIFISDIHLDHDKTHLQNRLLQFLGTLDHTVDALYILGDLFEYWVGDDDQTACYQNIKKTLKHLTDQQIPVYLMHGNRDFLLGDRFCRETGCLLLPDEAKIVLYGTPLLLMHGDTLCTEDHTYLRLRKIFHNRLLQQVFLWMPLAWRHQLAQKIRARSTQFIKTLSLAVMDVTEIAVQTVMQKHQVLNLIHGHTHRRAIHTLTTLHHAAKRIVLGSWHDEANALIWMANGQLEWFIRQE